MRMGINVPNELLQRARKVEPDLNISQICRGALQRRVDVAEVAAALALEDAEVIQRLGDAVGPVEPSPDWTAMAYEDARAWLRDVTPDQWRRFVYEAEFLRRQGRNESEMVDPWSGDVPGKGLHQRMWVEWREWFIAQYDDLFAIARSDIDLYGQARDEYSRAWLAYVRAAWKMLDERREKEYEALKAESLQRRRELWAPEAPEQLL